jgi:prepilin-type N-terminal cleavage/methylation domain-containing protein
MSYPLLSASGRVRRQTGFSLVELMVSITVSLIILGALSAMLVNVSGANSEMAKSNSQIENGRFAIQTLESDLVHAGFWGGFVPQFDDLDFAYEPIDVPNAVPDPCLGYTAAAWNFDYINQLLGMPVQTASDTLGGCDLPNKKTGTDILLVRHASLCLPNEAGCEADIEGKLYFQSTLCATATSGKARLATGASLDKKIRLAAQGAGTTTSLIPGAYIGMTIRIGVAGAYQTRKIVAYDATSSTAEVDASWTTNPALNTPYTIIEPRLSTNDFSLMGRNADCADAAAVLAPKRKFVSNIYYIRDYATVAGDGIPTLVRSAFDALAEPSLEHGAAEALVEGIDGFAVELGIDDTVTRCNLNLAVDYSDAVTKYDPATCAPGTAKRNMLPINRGDGNPDRFVRCTTAAPCTAADFSNAVVARLYLLVRNTEISKGFSDGKTFCLAARAADGACPQGSQVGPFSDQFKRHLFTTTVRLTTISGRRETPQ